MSLASETIGGHSPRRRARRRWPQVVLPVVVVALGAAALVASSRMVRPPARMLGTNAPINPSALDELDISAHNSPTVVANPRDPDNLVVASRVDAPRFSCALFVSLNAGATWERTSLALPEADPVSCFSPDVTFAADGTLYLSYTSFSNVEGLGTVPDAIWVAASSDGGRTMSPPVRASGPLGFQVRLAADPTVAERLFLAWVQASAVSGFGFPSPGNPVMMASSHDGGKSWQPPVTVTPPGRERVVAPSIAVSGAGEIHVAYLDVGDDALDYSGAHEGKGGDPYAGFWSIVAARSSDQGRTWTEAVVDDAVVPVQRFIQLFPAAPAIAVDGGREQVYIGFHDGRLGDADVWVWRSHDKGRSWAQPRRVNDTKARDGTAQYLPRVAVAPDGRLDVVYYDRRRDRHDVLTEASLQSSFDGGATFVPRLRLSDRAFDSRFGVGAERGLPDLGNRLGLLSTTSAVLAVWADTRGASGPTAKQDLSRAVVVFGEAPSTRRPLRAAGAAFLAAGGVALVVGLRTSRRQWRAA